MWKFEWKYVAFSAVLIKTWLYLQIRQNHGGIISSSLVKSRLNLIYTIIYEELLNEGMPLFIICSISSIFKLSILISEEPLRRSKSIHVNLSCTNVKGDVN